MKKALWLENMLVSQMDTKIANLSDEECSNTSQIFCTNSDLEAVPDLRRFRFLDTLSLQNNSLKDLPPWIAELAPNLESLNLNGNCFTRVPDVVRSLRKLKCLWIDLNKLTELPEWIAELSELESFTATSNDLIKIPASFGTLPNLSSLGLDGNANLPQRFQVFIYDDKAETQRVLKAISRHFEDKEKEEEEENWNWTILSATFGFLIGFAIVVYMVERNRKDGVDVGQN